MRTEPPGGPRPLAFVVNIILIAAACAAPSPSQVSSTRSPLGAATSPAAATPTPAASPTAMPSDTPTPRPSVVPPPTATPDLMRLRYASVEASEVQRLIDAAALRGEYRLPLPDVVASPGASVKSVRNSDAGYTVFAVVGSGPTRVALPALANGRVIQVEAVGPGQSAGVSGVTIRTPGGRTYEYAVPWPATSTLRTGDSVRTGETVLTLTYAPPMHPLLDQVLKRIVADAPADTLALLGSNEGSLNASTLLTTPTGAVVTVAADSPAVAASPTVPPSPSATAFPYSISGRVTSGGAPVADVRVQIAGDLRVSVTTGDDGRYQVSVPNGTFGVFFDPPAPFVAEWHQDATRSANAMPVRVSGASVVIDADLARGATLSGTVRCGGAGAPNAVVLAIDAVVGGASYRGTTDASGQYRLGVPTGGKYLIAAEPPTTSGCAGAWAGTEAYYAAAAEAVAVGGDTTRDIILPAGHRLAGRVTRADGSPAAGATVSVWAADPFAQPYSPSRQLYQVNEVGTDADGRFEMVLPPMSLRFYVAMGAQVTWWNGKASWSDATPVDMSTGDKTLDIRLATR